MVPARPRGWRGLALDAALGAALGAILFALETRTILNANAIGLDIDTRGPFAAFLAAIKPLVPALLARVLTAYLVAGGVLGVVAGQLASVFAQRPRALRAALYALNLAVLVVGLSWLKLIERPALADDLDFLRPFLAWNVDHGQPWQPATLLAGVLLPQLAVWLWRSSTRARLLLGAAAFVALLVPLAGTYRTPETAGNVPGPFILIGIDAFRPDRVEGTSPRAHVAPNLETFLAEATRFTHAYTPIAQTEPAWRSLLTARWPWRTGDRYPLTAKSRREALPTFAQEFDRAGFGTTFATDCSRFNYQDATSGFAERLEPPQGAVNFFLEKLRYRGLGVIADNRLGAWWLPEFVDNRALAGIHNPLAYADRLGEHLSGEAKQKPWLFAYHNTASHFPGDPVYPFYRAYVSPSEPLARRLRMYFSPLTPGSKGSWTREGAEALYDELLSQADAQLGTILDELKRKGLYDRATIVVFSDHGESFHADHPELAGATSLHGARLSDEENRILLAIKRPRGSPAAPRTVDALVRLLDLGPTLLDLAGLPPIPDADGVSLKPLLEGEALPALKLYAETGFTHASPDVFDPGHYSGGARGFDAYEVAPGGLVQMTPHAHDVAIAEKDVGAFDGAGWLIRSPRADGGLSLRCIGVCAASLEQWLDAVRDPAGPQPRPPPLSGSPE